MKAAKHVLTYVPGRLYNHSNKLIIASIPKNKIAGIPIFTCLGMLLVINSKHRPTRVRILR